MKNVKTTIILETRSQTREKQYPVKIRLTFEREQRYYAALVNNKRLYMTQRQFDNMMSAKKLSATRKGLDAILDKADSIIQELDPFTFKMFSQKWHGPKQQKNNLVSGFSSTIIRLKSENRIGTALSYRDAMNSIINYSGSTLRYTDINKAWLKGYENHMLSTGKSITTLSMYLRALRVILRSEGKSFLKSNPFEGYLIPSGNNRKNEALTIEQIKKLSRYDSKSPTKQMSLDFWLFSYSCGGANYEDIFRLQWHNINYKQNFVSFFRRKTKRTRKSDVRPIIVPLSNRMIQTIEKYGNDSDDSYYVFPILDLEMTEERKKLRVKYVTKNFNKHTKNVGKELKLDINLTSTVARHSRASIMNFQGQHYSIISEMLGHISISTTENYLKSFPVESQLQAMMESDI